MKRKAIYSICLLSVLVLYGCMRTHDTRQATSIPMKNILPGISSAPLQDKDVAAFSATVRPIHGEIKAKYDLAKYFQRLHKHRIAIETLKEIIQTDPGHAEAYNLMGFSYDCMGEYKTAQAHYRQAIAIHPGMVYAHNNLGYSYLLNREYKAAIQTFEKAIALDETNEKIHKNLGLACFLNGNMEKAVASFGMLKDEQKAASLMLSLGIPAKFIPAGKAGQTPVTLPSETLAVNENPTVSGKKLELPEPPRVAVNHPEPLTPIADHAISEATFAPVSARVESILKTSGPKTSGLKTSTPITSSPETSVPEKPIPVYATAIAPVPANEMKPVGSALSSQRPSARVEISNGNGQRGLAKTLGNHLSANGIAVYRLTNADHFNHPETLIYYRKGFYNEAVHLKSLLPVQLTEGHLIESDPGSEPVRVLIGRNLLTDRLNEKSAAVLEIANGNGVPGMAGRLGKQLTRQGIKVARLTNAKHFGYQQTQVYYNEGQEEQARRIADSLQKYCQAKLTRLDTPGNHVKVIFGSDMVL